MYKKANVSKKAEIISSLSATNEGSCGYGIDGKVGKEPAGSHLLKKNNLIHHQKPHRFLTQDILL